MGCDGGTIPRRNELVKTKAKKEVKDKNASLIAKWKYCAISSKELRKPIVSCLLGYLYNKEAIIEYLLNKDECPNASLVGHIRSLKDVVELKLTSKPQSKSTTETSTESSTSGDSPAYFKYICPISGLEMNGNYKFFYSSSCGCVISERAVREVKSDVCLVCGKSYDGQQDLIPLNPSQEELEQLKTKMLEKRANEKKKKSKSGGKRKHEETASEPEASSSKKAVDAAGSSSSATVKTSCSDLLTAKSSKEYSVKKDPNASEAYKSLFTTHETAKNQPRAHWVTFNPGYY